MGANDIDIRLVDGRAIRLRELEQSLVYEGLTDGVPTRGGNARLVEAFVAGASAHGSRVVLLPPVESLIPGMGGDGPDEACTLPRTVVRARFESRVPVSPAGAYSELTVMWFQDRWAPPIAPDAEALLRTVDWDAHARDMVW